MININTWYDFNKVVANLNNLDELQFNGEIGEKIKTIIDVYGQEIPYLCEKYSDDIFKIVYSSRNIGNSSNDLEKKLIQDFAEDFKPGDVVRSMNGLNFEIFEKIVKNGPELFDENIANLFIKNYPSDVLKKIYYGSGDFKVYVNIDDFALVVKNIDFEDYFPFLTEPLRGENTIKKLLENNPEITIEQILPIIRIGSDFYNELCNKIEKDSESLASRDEKANLLVDYIKKYTVGNHEPEIRGYNFENFLFLSPEVLKSLIPQNEKKILGMVEFYDKFLPALIEKYGYDLLQKTYSKSEFPEKTEDMQSLEDFEKVFQNHVENAIANSNISMTFEEFKNFYTNASENASNAHINQMFSKYSDEVLKLMYSKYGSKFEISYGIPNKLEIFKSVKYEDYKPFLTKDWSLLYIDQLLKEDSEFDINLFMPILRDINPFYEDLYNKCLNENSDLSGEELNRKLLDTFVSWRKNNGSGLPKIYHLKDFEQYSYVRPEIRITFWNNYNSSEKKIIDFYGLKIFEIINKYGLNIINFVYGNRAGMIDNMLNTSIVVDDLESKFIQDFHNIFELDRSQNIIYINRKMYSYEDYKKIVLNSPEGVGDDKEKDLFRKYPDEKLKNLFRNATGRFEINKESQNLQQVFLGLEYKDIISYIDNGYWFREDVDRILKNCFNSEQYDMIKELRNKTNLINGKDAFALFYDKENPERIIEYIKKINNSKIINFIMLNEYDNFYQKCDEIYEKYGEYLKNINLESVNKGNEPLNIDELIEQAIAKAIKNRTIKKYGENLPEEFKEKYSKLFLPEEVPDEIKEKFYNRTLKYSDFVQDGKLNIELWQILKEQHLYLGFKEDLSFLTEIYEQSENIENINSKIIEVVRRIEELEENQMSKETKNIVWKWFTNIDIQNMDNDVFSKKLRNIYIIVEHIILSNSSELRAFQDKILDELLNVENPMQTLIKIEKGFLTKEKTIDERLFLCFTYLHPNLLEFCKIATSPIIKKYVKEGNEEAIKKLLRLDLLNSMLHSNNREMRNDFKIGNISEEEMNLLKELGINSTQEALEYMDKSAKEADERNRKNAKSGKIEIKEGDFIKGLRNDGIIYLEQILQNGSCCQEFLGAGASTDGTPLDTDVSIIGSDGIKNTYSYKGTWGPIYVIYRNDENVVDLREYNSHPQDITEEQILETQRKLELCGTKGRETAGFRSVAPTDKIVSIMFEEGTYDKRIEVLLAQQPYYIPICDVNHNVVFSEKQYDQLRAKMQGLSYYGTENGFEFGSHLINDDILQLETQLDSIHINNSLLKNQIYASVQNAIEKYNESAGLSPEEAIKLKDFISDKLFENELEMISTGSSDRNTNIPGGKLDFDFILRFDNKFFKSQKCKERKEEIIRFICKELNITYQSGDIKDVDVLVGDENVKADFSIIGKTNKVEYSTEMCLQDRLESIKSLDPDKYRYVIANIMLAKKVLKDNNVYSKRDGGLGGVGIENWILQHGGSFYDAVTDFLQVAQACNKDYGKFKQQCVIWDFGKNHYAYKEGKNNFPYDDFIFANLKEDKFQGMVTALEEYMRTHNFEEFGEQHRYPSDPHEITMDTIQILARENGVPQVIGLGKPLRLVEELSKPNKEVDKNTQALS